MAIDATELETLLDGLIRARAQGLRSLLYEGKRVEYGSDAEMAAAIADLVRVGWQHVRNGRIACQRHKTSVCADMPLRDDLARELDRLPRDRMLFVTHGRDHRLYTPASLGNWFRDRCREAGIPGSLHGLRKAGATFLANAGATEWEIASFLAHTDTSQVREYTMKANRSRLTDSGFARLPEGKMSNFSESLDGGAKNDARKQVVVRGNGSP